jgi:cyclohexadienyl dehydratase
MFAVLGSPIAARPAMLRALRRVTTWVALFIGSACVAACANLESGGATPTSLPSSGSPVGSAGAGASTVPSSPTGSRLDEVIASHRLRVCTTGDYKPYSFLRPDGRYEGIDIDLVESLAKSLNAKVDYVATSWPKLMDDFTSRCDIAVGGVSTTLERQKHAAFSTAYLVDGKTPIARCDAVGRYATLADLDRPSVRVIVNPGGTNEQFARAHLSHAQITVYRDNVTIFKQIVDGNADVMVTDKSETLLQHKLNPSLCPVNPDTPLQYGEKAFLLPRGDVEFEQYVDQWLHLLRETGDFARVVDAWLK